MSRKYLQTKKTSLSYSISDSETAFRLEGIYKLDGTSISASDIGDYMTFTIDPGTSKEEICSVASSGVTVNADGTVDLTGVVRGLQEIDPYTTGGYSAEHGAGAVVVFSNNPQLYNQLANKSNANTFTALNLFSGYAPQTDTDPVAGNDMVRLSYLQALILGTLTTIDVVVPGTAGETIAAGNLIYLNTDNKWYKCDADTASTVNNVLLGIAKGAGTANNPITNSILLQGVDTNQSGLTGGNVQYASNTAGAISSTPGTTEVTVGVAKSTTELYFAPRFNQMLTENQQDAMDNANSPSASNYFLTNNDSTGTGLLVRKSMVKYGGTGADGALSITSGTTTIDLGGAQYVIKNYTSISITGTGALAFTNPHANGTIVILKSQGDVTLTSSTTPLIDTRGMGATSATDGTGMFLRGISSTTSAGGLQWSPCHTIAQMVANKSIYVACGSGGGNARTLGNATGGRGGGGLYIECGGALNGTGTINTSGSNGNSGTGESGGAGGGSAGLCVITYATLTANTLTITATGGNGSAGVGSSTGNGDGGAGAGGKDGAGGTGADSGAGGNAAGAGAGGGGGSTAGGNQAGGNGGSSIGGFVFANTELS